MGAMPITVYVSHPQVVIDADVPVPEWGLNDNGHARAAALADAALLTRIDRLVTSDETKARDTTRHLLADPSIPEGWTDPEGVVTERHWVTEQPSLAAWRHDFWKVSAAMASMAVPWN